MVNLDLKDRKILYQLDLNCRQSNTQIGKKVGLSKQVVDYRIKRMEEKGIITGYWTAINTYRLGYYVFRVYINFIDISSSIKEEIIKYFCDEKDVWTVITSKGPVDLDVIYGVNDIYKFNQSWDETLQKYGIYFSDAIVSILTDTTCCKKSYLIIDDYEKDRILYRTSCKEKPIKIEEIDYRILDLIALKGRTPIIDIAEKLNCSSQTIQYHLKHLIKVDIIQAFRVSVNNLKLGFQNCAIDVFLKDRTKKKEILDHIIQNPYIYDIMGKNIGWSDLTFQLTVEKMDGVFQVMDNLEKKFPTAIRKVNYWMSQVVHKDTWLPEMEFK